MAVETRATDWKATADAQRRELDEEIDAAEARVAELQRETATARSVVDSLKRLRGRFANATQLERVEGGTDET
jgi:hypothetical protein